MSDARGRGTSRVPKLKIREVRAIDVSVDSPTSLKGFEGRYFHYVRVYTDQGLTGTGEMVDTLGAAEMINSQMGPSIVGRDPLDIEAIYDHFWSFGAVPHAAPPVFVRGMGGPYLTAMSGIDMALWDLAGKAMGVPVHRLMGGKVRDRVAVYFWLTDLTETKRLIREKNARMFKVSVDQVTAAGDAKGQFDPGKASGWTLMNSELDDIAGFLQSRRDAIGPKIELAIECHARYNTESAIQLGRAVAPFRPAWIEEPVTSDNVDALALVRRSVPVPVACGENVYTRFGFREVLDKQAAGIIQPDMAKCGGLLEARKIASLAEIYHVPIAPHGVASPLGGMAFAHVCATTPNFMVLEWGRFWNPALNALMKNLPQYESGFVQVPETPGIGIELNDEAVREHLARPGKWES